jgi:ribosome-associated translation inhibitor RaiA
MNIEVTIDQSIERTDELVGQVQDEVGAAIINHIDRLTWVTVHVGDENGAKAGANDKRCAIEVHPSGHQPVVAVEFGASALEACAGAADKLEHLLDHLFERLDDRRGESIVSGE